jgi:hypothetical protein
LSFVAVSDVVGQLNASGPDSNSNYTVYGLTLSNASLQAHVNYANTYVNALLGAAYSSAGTAGILTTDPRYASARIAAIDLACIRCLVVSMGGSLIGAYDYFLGDLRVSRAGPYATAIKMTIEGLKEDLIRQIVNLATVIKTADGQAAGEVPTYRGGLISP